MDAPPQLIDQFETLWRERIADQVQGGEGAADELERLQSALSLRLPPDYIRLQQLVGSRSKHVFPHFNCSIEDARRLTEELPSLLAYKGFNGVESTCLKSRSLAFGEAEDHVYFVGLASGLEDPMAYRVGRSGDEEGFNGWGSMMQVFLEHAKRRWG